MSAPETVDEATETAPRRWREVWFPAGVYAAVASVLLVAQHVSARQRLGDDWGWDWRGLNYYLRSWSQFDGPEYVRIATEGYSYTPGQRSNIVWFPLYPNLLRAARWVVEDPIVAGVAVSLVGGVVAAVLWWRWLRGAELTGRERTVAFLALMLYPYGWYLYGAVHSDSVFLASVLGAFLLVERRRYLLAGLVGALATAGRPTGLALAPALVLLATERERFLVVPAAGREWIRRWRVPLAVDRARWRWALLLPLLALLGIGAYMTYLAVRFGEPFAFATNQRAYHPTRYPWLKLAVFVRWRDFSDDPRYALTITAQMLLSVAVLVSSPRVGRRFGWGYALFCASLVLIPASSTPDFMGSGRYLIAAFPAFALYGSWLSRRERWVPKLALGLGAVALVGLSMGFARSWYLS